MSKGQVSVEFIVLFLALLVAIVVSTMTPGVFGLNKSVEVSSASLAHAALSKVKTNIEVLSVSGEGSSKMVYVKSPPSTWVCEGKTIHVSGNGFDISTNTSITLSSENKTVPTLMILSINLTRMADHVEVTIQ